MHDNRLTKLRREQVKPQTKQSKILKKKLAKVALNSVKELRTSQETSKKLQINYSRIKNYRYLFTLLNTIKKRYNYERRILNKI
jgi:mannose/fructose/N-acetylgalactosamine-specific phosphotransferase system component IID